MYPFLKSLLRRIAIDRSESSIMDFGLSLSMTSAAMATAGPGLLIDGYGPHRLARSAKDPSLGLHGPPVDSNLHLSRHIAERVLLEVHMRSATASALALHQLV